MRRKRDKEEREMKERKRQTKVAVYVLAHVTKRHRDPKHTVIRTET